MRFIKLLILLGIFMCYACTYTVPYLSFSPHSVPNIAYRCAQFCAPDGVNYLSYSDREDCIMFLCQCGSPGNYNGQSIKACLDRK